jgi:hypothetical protein
MLKRPAIPDRYEEVDFNSFCSYDIPAEFMMGKEDTRKESERRDIIKRNLISLKTYEISFYGHFFQLTGLWKVKWRCFLEKD